nr:MAG TPA: hypothetical protein [Bacteriophage sp.]
MSDSTVDIYVLAIHTNSFSYISLLVIFMYLIQ